MRLARLAYMLSGIAMAHGYYSAWRWWLAWVGGSLVLYLWGRSLEHRP